jgi:RHS repeat-associated protein
LQIGTDPGVGPLPRIGGVPVDLLGRPVVERATPAPHGLYRATGEGASPDTLRAYYDASGNMTALVVHRPDGCGREDTTGGVDGSGCRETADFRLLFAWDEVGNLLATERQTLIDTRIESCAVTPIAILPVGQEEFLVPEEDRANFAWCPTARVDSTFDFGGQRRLKAETNLSDWLERVPEGYSLYVSASFEVREANWDGEYDEAFEDGLYARYLWNEAGILFELDSEAPEPVEVGMPKTRLTLTNQIGSASTILNADTGGIAEALSQLPYGAEEQTLPAVELGDPAAFTPRYEFTGKERDRGVGLVYFGARSLDPRLGRWVSADPVTVQGTGGNGYAYAAANPVRLVDPNGLDDVDAGTSPDVAPTTGDAGAATSTTPQETSTSDGGTDWAEVFEAPAGEDAGPTYDLETTTFTDRDTGQTVQTTIDPNAGTGPDAHVAYIPPNPGEQGFAVLAVGSVIAAGVGLAAGTVVRAAASLLGVTGKLATVATGAIAGGAGAAAASAATQLGTTGEIDGEQLLFDTGVGVVAGAVGGALQCREPSPTTAVVEPPNPSSAPRPTASEPRTRLYHGGELPGGQVARTRFSTTPSLEHAQAYAAESGGQVYTFDVPKSRMYELEGSGQLTSITDLHEASGSVATEWRFQGTAACREMNQYMVH